MLLSDILVQPQIDNYPANSNWQLHCNLLYIDSAYEQVSIPIIDPLMIQVSDRRETAQYRPFIKI